MSDASFQQWGWRLPFLLSIILVALSLYVRFRMNESPIFVQLKSVGSLLLKETHGTLLWQEVATPAPETAT